MVNFIDIISGFFAGVFIIGLIVTIVFKINQKSIKIPLVITVLSLITTATLLFLPIDKTIDPNRPEATTSYISEIFQGDGSYVESQEEWDMGIRATYRPIPAIDVILDSKDDNIEQINIRGVSKEDIKNVLSHMSFPLTDAMDSVLNEDNPTYEDYFTSYDGVGVKINFYNEMDRALMHMTYGSYPEKDFGMNIIFNEDRFKEFK